MTGQHAWSQSQCGGRSLNNRVFRASDAVPNHSRANRRVGRLKSGMRDLFGEPHVILINRHDQLKHVCDGAYCKFIATSWMR